MLVDPSFDALEFSWLRHMSEPSIASLAVTWCIGCYKKHVSNSCSRCMRVKTSCSELNIPMMWSYWRYSLYGPNTTRWSWLLYTMLNNTSCCSLTDVIIMMLSVLLIYIYIVFLVLFVKFQALIILLHFLIPAHYKRIT